MHEDRLQRLRLPSTLVGLLQARLDALPASERLAARQASVIGYVFWDDALLALDAAQARLLGRQCGQPASTWRKSLASPTGFEPVLLP